MGTTLLLGAVAYDPKVVRIWDGFRAWFRDHDLPLDYVLYSNYERQVDELVAGRIHLAWNSPLAWVRAARAAGTRVRPLAMRDTDQDLTSVVVVRSDSRFDKPSDLAGCLVATGAIDSPQATLIPLAYLAEIGVDVRSRRFDVGVGLHGDHIGGERDAARALADGTVDAALLLDASHLLFANEATLPPGSTRVLVQTPPYDHCNLTVVDRGPGELVDRFVQLLLGMSYADPELRELFDLEGLTEWRPGRETGYAALDAAVDRFGFYDDTGKVTMPEYVP
jgi:phosphonate transport system substrate-binding protein